MNLKIPQRHLFRFISLTPGLLFREDGDVSSNTVSDIERKEQENEEEGLLCRKCGHVITSPDHQIQVNGGHLHTFFNPAGVIYEIGCFSNAPGCLQYGPSSSEFTWFAGFTWRLSLCGLCTAQLGWFFSSSDTIFYGLILKNLS